MGYYICLGCNLKTGNPNLHTICNNKLTQWEICTCGSGGHPRWCDLHPKAFKEHIAEINTEADIDEREMIEKTFV